jgi:ribosomal protein S18 acetylase RimI-like enzyme
MPMATSERPRVCLLFPSQYAEAAAMLGRAFADDPLLKALVPPTPDAESRARHMGALFDVVLRLHRGDGQPVVGVIQDSRVCAAAVIEYVANPSSTAATVLHGLPQMPRLVRAVGWSGVARAISVLDTLARNRPPEPHLYLNILGVEPSLQRRHFGVAILDYLREQVSLRGDFTSVYLETATEANVAYYSHVGYQVMNEIYPLGVRMWRMLQPRDHRA